MTASKAYKWDKKDLLGTGNFAEVFKATVTEPGRPVGASQTPMPAMCALKVIDKSKVEDMNDITREIEIMQVCEHDHIIRLYEVYDEPKKEYLSMELVTGGELFDRIVNKGHYTEKDAAQCIYELCSALDYLHKKNIVHRDLKPENLLYSSPDDNAKLKVADFGLARSLAAKG